MDESRTPSDDPLGEPPTGEQRPNTNPAPGEDREQERLFTFLGRIQAEPELREQINWMQTAQEVSELATAEGHPFQAETLITLLQRCNEATSARLGLMDEKLIRLFLRRDSLR